MGRSIWTAWTGLATRLRTAGALAAAAAVAMGCGGQLTQAPAAPACSVEVSELWATNSVGVYTADAVASGATCQSASLSLQIRDDRGAILWTARHETRELFGFDRIETAEQMRVALREWMTQAGGFSRSSDLPAWRAGAVQPVNEAGFFFAPNPGVDRSAYQSIRAAARPLFCYVQGRESVFCLALPANERRVIPLGAQTFPG